MLAAGAALASKISMLTKKYSGEISDIHTDRDVPLLFEEKLITILSYTSSIGY